MGPYLHQSCFCMQTDNMLSVADTGFEKRGGALTRNFSLSFILKKVKFVEKSGVSPRPLSIRRKYITNLEWHLIFSYNFELTMLWYFIC